MTSELSALCGRCRDVRLNSLQKIWKVPDITGDRCKRTTEVIPTPSPVKPPTPGFEGFSVTTLNTSNSPFHVENVKVQTKAFSQA